MAFSDDDERRLRIELMQADIDNKPPAPLNRGPRSPEVTEGKTLGVDSDYKRGLVRWEPWKVMIAAIGATAVLFGVLGGLAGYKIGSTPPPAPIVIQVPAAPAPASR